MLISVFGISLEILGEGAVEQREGLVEATLITPERRLQGEDVRTISESISRSLFPGLPPRIGHQKGLIRSAKVPSDPASVGEMGPGEGTELVDPPGFEGRSFLEGVGDEHAELRELCCPVRLVGGDFPALPAEELAETPTREASGGADEAMTALVGMAGETPPEVGRLGAGAGESHLHRAEADGEGAGLVEVEEVAAGSATLRTDGDQMEESAVLVLGAIFAQEALQGALIQMVMLQAGIFASCKNKSPELASS
jgi:hypothetical protein